MDKELTSVEAGSYDTDTGSVDTRVEQSYFALELQLNALQIRRLAGPLVLLNCSKIILLVGLCSFLDVLA